jgi:predicted alpha/beta hydrolase family esterase
MHELELLLVPRWGGSSASDFYPWLTDLLQGLPDGRSARARVSVPELPAGGPPTVEGWTGAVEKALLARGPGALARTVLLGHSVGAQAAWRAVARLPDGLRLLALVGVAAWWTVDEPWPDIVPWIETPFDWQRARQATDRRLVLLSDNDPFTADHRTTARLFEERLAAECRLQPDAKHFNGAQEPAVLTLLNELLTGS